MTNPDYIVEIFEGQPIFSLVNASWLYGLAEGAIAIWPALVRMRTYDSGMMMQKIRNARKNGEIPMLSFRDSFGLEGRRPILAGRVAQTDEMGVGVVDIWVGFEPYLTGSPAELE